MFSRSSRGSQGSEAFPAEAATRSSDVTSANLQQNLSLTIIIL